MGRPRARRRALPVEAIVLRAKKSEIVDGLRGVFSDAGAVVVTHYTGLSVAEVSELRRGMREAGAAFRVTKNTLARIALADTPFAPLERLFTGPTAIAWSSDPVAAPKAVVGFAKRNEKLAIVGGALPGNLLTAEQVRALADLPSIDELRARLVGLLTTPAARLVAVLQAPGGQLARVLAARAEQSG
jgi:large subunit ribosomal protein L10